MALIDRILISMLVTSIGIVGAFEIAETIKPQSTLVRSGSDLCYEVAYELEQEVISGRINKSEAEDIIKRCFKKFGDVIDV
jgi:hypothetical protein